MAVVTRYVNTASTAGGDGTTNGTAGATRAYASLSEWEAAEQADLVTATDTHIVNCSGTAADTTQFTLAGWTTDATYFITINGDNTTGTYSTSHYRSEITTTGNFYYNFTISNDYTVVNDMQVFSTNAAYTNNRIYYTTADYVDFNRCIVKAAVTTSMTSFGFMWNAGDGGSATNCLAFDIDKTGSAGFNILLSGTTADVALDNCTAYNCDYGFKQQYKDTALRNCLAQGGVQGFDTIGSNYGSIDYCCSDVSGEAVGTNGVIGTVTFVDAANDDYMPASGDTVAKDAGQDLSGTFTDDLAGTTRDASFDIGALEYVASGPSITSEPAVVRPSGTGYELGGTFPNTGTSTATLVMNGTTSVSCTITGLTATTLTFSMPAAPASLFDATGFTFTFTDDDSNADTSAVVPYDPPTTHDFITLTSIAGTDADFTFGYAGATVASGKQVVYETPTTEDTLAIVVSADCSFTLGSPLTQNNTSDYYVIDADGTIGVTDTNTFLFSAGSGGTGNGGFISSFGKLGLR